MTDFVVYLTIYRGNKMPPFYIGYSSESKVLQGYNGTVKSRKYRDIWKSERQENPQLFKTLVIET